MLRIDLHTHSLASPDGGLKLSDYQSMIRLGRLDVVAITDHNRIDFAQNAFDVLGDAILIGEEISCREGDLIGLYLNKVVPAGLPATEAAKAIRGQHGLVYIPHPFETARKGIPESILAKLLTAGLVDILETYNGRTLQNRSSRAQRWASEHDLATASSSDAHGRRGWGNTASTVVEMPTSNNLVALLRESEHDTKSTGIFGRLYPKYNRLWKSVHHV